MPHGERIDPDGRAAGNGGQPVVARKGLKGRVFIYRILDGKVVEGWENADALGLVQQLGLIPGARIGR